MPSIHPSVLSKTVPAKAKGTEPGMNSMSRFSGEACELDKDSHMMAFDMACHACWDDEATMSACQGPREG